MSMNFLRADGTLDVQPGAASVWLPSIRQISDALQFQVSDAVGPERHEDEIGIVGKHTTMQQGMGLVVAVGVIAGALPFLVNLIRATAAGTSLQMLSLAEFATQRTRLWTLLGLEPVLMGDTFQQIAGMSPRVPGFLAALFSALGVWINTPLSFLTLWLAYGAGVLAVAHLAGATTTLQRFFAGTAYAFLPLVLLTLVPTPVLGDLLGWIAMLAFVLLYIRAVATVTGVDTAKTVICVLLPGAIFFSLWLIALGMLFGALLTG